MTVDNSDLEELSTVSRAVRPAALVETPGVVSVYPEADLGEPEAEVEEAPETIDLETVEQGLDVSASQEETRAKIAWNFTQFFLALISLTILIPFLSNIIRSNTFSNPLETSKELLTVVASVLAGPFGFIVGFYFKKGGD